MGEEQLSDQQIRSELKKMVEREKASFLQEWSEAEASLTPEIVAAEVDGEAKAQALRHKMGTVREEANRKFEMLLDFIDRP